MLSKALYKPGVKKLTHMTTGAVWQLTVSSSTDRHHTNVALTADFDIVIIYQNIMYCSSRRRISSSIIQLIYI